MMRHLRFMAISLFVCLLPGNTAVGEEAAKSNDSGKILTLEAVAAGAVRDNPGLEEMRSRAEAMAAIPSQEGTLPDPTLSFNALNFPTNTFSYSQEPMTQLQIGIRQAVPFPGKLALREEAASHEADAATDNVAEARLRLVRDVKSSWWQLYYLDRALRIVRSNKDLLRQFVDIATTKYKVGQGLQQDVLLAQVELSRLLDLEVQLQGSRRNEAARLNALLNRSADAEVRLPASVDTDLPEVLPEAKLYPLAEKLRPLLAERRKRIDAARSRVALAEKDYYPNFEVGAAYGFRGGHNADGSNRADFASFGLSLNLPVYAASKQSKAVDQRNSELMEKTYALQDAWAQVRKEITSARADYEQAREQAILFNTGILPQTRQTVSSMLAGYQVNKVDFLNLVQTQITLYNYEIQYWKVLAAANQALAKLSAAVGEDAYHE